MISSDKQHQPQNRRERSQLRKRKVKNSLITATTLVMLVVAGILVIRVNGGDIPELKNQSLLIDRNPAPESKVVTPITVPSTSTTPNNTSSDPIKLTFVGDIMLGSTVENVMRQDGFDSPYRLVRSYLQNADLTIANLETPITERGTPQKKDYVYRSSPKVLPAFKEAGFDIVNLANNHSMDYGPQGLLDTFDVLDKAGIKRIGAGRDADEAYRPVIVESKGMKIAFLGFSRVVPESSWKAGKNNPGIAETYQYQLATNAIARVRPLVDLIVVIPHWGDERKDKPNKDQIDLAKRYIDAGADLIVASHPHVLQGFESYKGKWIAYSLGNFIFTTNSYKETWETIILEASCTKDRACQLNAVPVFTVGAKPQPMSGDAGRKLLQRLSTISIHSRVDENGRVISAP